ncbi:tripartite tricarboxylate transporter TctB family protein [Caenimonas sedimenti]|uniref:Tripartite tricarboxylate transporter TctB family protein n=1 Tax=Caenimonas sedimenti TaxID=2596921 RepID=A0A562ZTR1_9BURK|nr:tripartite tricarboxylate transporter TctB family protein [Caenimonas sedimenti]TWO71718.1 tripartite tricarboxylate transporter TctB family protein [Caenimonas sedimenti]
MKLNDAVFGLLLLALGGLVLFAVQGFPKIPGQPVGPALFPGIIAIGLCVAGAGLVVKGWVQRGSQPWIELEDWVRSRRHVAALAVLLGSIVFYIAAANWLGFLPVAVIVLTALMATLGVGLPRALLIAVIATLLIHFAFYKLLRVPLPWGVLKNFAW